MDTQTEKAPTKPAAPAAVLTLPKADADLRNHFAGIVLREIVAWQLSNKRASEEDVAASWSFRYADRMLAQSKKLPRDPALRVKGVPGITEEPIVEAQ